MPLLTYAHTVAAIRAAEQPLLEAQSEPGQLMKSAARNVAIAAQTMVNANPLNVNAERILILAGSGGNGGDGLYAGALLAKVGYPVDALLLGKDSLAHAPALKAFREAGGHVLYALDRAAAERYCLVIDAILGIGGKGGLRREVTMALENLRAGGPAVLSVDIPSGIDADTGELPEPFSASLAELGIGPAMPDDVHTQRRTLPAHVRADVTITFGGLRYAHAQTTACGEVILCDPEIDGRSISTELLTRMGQHPLVYVTRVNTCESQYTWPENWVQMSPEAYAVGQPSETDNKYSGGVVGIVAGSGAYPGAAILCTSGAVRATNSMVRYVGDQALEVVRAHPEIVATRNLRETGQVQAWVFGPGSGTGDAAAETLSELLQRDEKLLIDADGITLLAERPELIELLRDRTAETVLTPHSGEFRRLTDALNLELPSGHVQAALEVSDFLGITLLLKGRFTVVASEGEASVIDAGSSWAATPGSGDVLSGLAGKYLAIPKLNPRQAVGSAVQIHAAASCLSAQTPYGPAPTSATRIAEAIPSATAWISDYAV